MDKKMKFHVSMHTVLKTCHQSLRFLRIFQILNVFRSTIGNLNLPPSVQRHTSQEQMDKNLVCCSCIHLFLNKCFFFPFSAILLQVICILCVLCYMFCVS